ncbi:MAG: helix-turn-helix domain-containing protein [Lysobacterales bacterium]
MRLGLRCGLCLVLGMWAAGAGGTTSFANESIPYRQFSPVIDGNVGEWRSPWYTGTIAADDGAQETVHRAELRLCWDRDSLIAAGVIHDPTLIKAPPDLDVNLYHQYDSAQIYLDALGDAGARMNDDDVDLLLLPDGRVGVLRGDALIGALAGATVPQRVAAPLSVEYAARTHAGGWTFELRIPFAGLGLDAAAGRELGIDMVYNDWLVEHPPGTAEALTAERVRILAQRPSVPDTTDEAVGRDVWPRSWSGDTDFGYPDRWRRLSLSGHPGIWELTLQTLGTATALLLFGLGGLAVGLVWAAWIRARYRRQLHQLLARLSPDNDLAPVPTDATADSSDEAPEREKGSVREREFAEAVLAHVRQHLQEALTPATLAEHFHVSPRTLQRRLKVALNTSPQELVLVARLQAAQALLRSGRYRVGEVATRVGFEDLSYFSRRYRLTFGHAPSAEIADHAGDSGP